MDINAALVALDLAVLLSDFDGGLAEARVDVQAGRVVSRDEVKRRWGIK